jgi:hypothetical protein
LGFSIPLKFYHKNTDTIKHGCWVSGDGRHIGVQRRAADPWVPVPASRNPFLFDERSSRRLAVPPGDLLVSSPFRRDAIVASASRRDPLVGSATRRWIINSTSAGTTSVPLRLSPRRDALVASASRRDPLVGSATRRWIINSTSAGTTGVPLRLSPRRDAIVGSASRRDPLVGSATRRWIINSTSAGTSSVPLRFGHTASCKPMPEQSSLIHAILSILW